MIYELYPVTENVLHQIFFLCLWCWRKGTNAQNIRTAAGLHFVSYSDVARPRELSVADRVDAAGWMCSLSSPDI
jgi:hypothetical protein